MFSFIAIRIAANLARDGTRTDPNFQLTETGGADSHSHSRSRQTASSATYVEREGAGHPSILQVLGSPKAYGYQDKLKDEDKLGEDSVLDIAKDNLKSRSASASVESLVFAPVPVSVPAPFLLSPNRLEESERGVRVQPGEAV